MSSFSDKLFGTRKWAAYGGWFCALVGGSFIGFGVGGLFIVRFFAEELIESSPNLILDPNAYATIHIWLFFTILVGFIFAGLGIYEIRHSLKSPEGKTMDTQHKKRFCQFCGAEAKNGASFCSDCGKKLI